MKPKELKGQREILKERKLEKLEKAKMERMQDDPNLIWIDAPMAKEQYADFSNSVFAMLDNIYTITIDDIMSYLHCSRQFVERYIIKEVKHIFLNNTVKGILFSNSDRDFPSNFKNFYFFDRDDFFRFLKEHTVMTRQTISFNLYDYTENAEKLTCEINNYAVLKQDFIYMSVQERNSIVSQYDSKIYDLLNKEGRILYKDRIRRNIERNNYPHLVVREEFPERLEKANAFGFHRETAYRNLFQLGAIKYSISIKDATLIRYDASLLSLIPYLSSCVILPYSVYQKEVK